MLKVLEAIVVEGKYDKNTLCQIVDAPIFQTDGFGIMKNKALLDMLRLAAQKRGLIVFTDSDGAGFIIRNYLKSAIPADRLKHAYIPDIYGKERRKQTASKEGKLGVEGMPPQIIMDCLRRAGATVIGEAQKQQDDPITKMDFYNLGLSGGANSSFRRQQILRQLGLPEHMSANAMLQALNLFYTKEELYQLISAQPLDLENNYG